MAKKSSSEGGTYERLHFSATKTWQRACDLYVQIQAQLATVETESAQLIKSHLAISLEDIALRVALGVDTLAREQKKHFFHQAIEACVAAQSYLLLANAANLFDLTSFNDELEILIRQIAANIGHLNENSKTVTVDNPS